MSRLSGRLVGRLLQTSAIGGCLLGCGGNAQQGPGLTFHLSGRPLAGASGCYTGAGDTVDSTALTGGALRLSVVRRTAAASTFVCDLVAKVPGDRPNLDLGAEPGATYDVFTEYFEGATRSAAGALLNLSAQTRTGPLDIQLFRAGEWSCPQSPMQRDRAFHTATLLPDGEVLLIGGLAALTDPSIGGGSNTYQVLNSVEVYDPRSGQFYKVGAQVKGEVRRGRAFHRAAVVESGPTYFKLIVFGGVTSAEGKVALDTTVANSQLPFSPTNAAQPGGAEVVFYYPATRTEHTVPISSASVPGAAFAGAAALPGALLAAGGESFPQGQELSGVQSYLTPVYDARALSAAAGADGSSTMSLGNALPRWLVAPSVTLVSGDTALVVGASRAPVGMPPDVRLSAALITGLPAAVMVGAALEPGGPATVFHSATRVGDGAALLTGGLVLQSGILPQTAGPPPAAQAVRLYQHSGGAVSLTTVAAYGAGAACNAAGARYRSAAYEAATATAGGGRVLLTGGSPTARQGGCSDCEAPDASGGFCVLKQASIYDAQSRTLQAAPGLALGRMGHQQTLMTDGNVLVTGGLVRQDLTSAVTPATSEAVVYAPRGAGDADPDDPVRPLLEAQGLKRTGLVAARPCKLVE